MAKLVFVRNYCYENIPHLFGHSHENQTAQALALQTANQKSGMCQAVHQASTHSRFCSMKRLGVFLSPPPLPPFNLPGWDASPLQGYPQALNLPVPIYTRERILWLCERKVFRPKTQYNVSSQGLNPDCLK